MDHALPLALHSLGIVAAVHCNASDTILSGSSLPHGLELSLAMDLAKTLIRSVVRAFYGTRHVLVIDALMIHSAYVDMRTEAMDSS